MQTDWGKAFVSLSIWRRPIHERGWIRPRHRVYPAKPKEGIRPSNFGGVDGLTGTEGRRLGGGALGQEVLSVVLVDVEFDHERAGRLRSPFIRANQRASIRFGPRKNTKPTIAEKTPGGRGPDERSALALQTPQG